MNRLFSFFCICCVALTCLSAGDAGAASFDCNRTARPTEKLICADKGLSTLDAALARMYVKRREDVPTPETITADQRAWLRDVRDKCTDVKCLRSAYAARIAYFNEENASFDCAKASTAAETMICRSPSLRAADFEVGKTFRAASAATLDLNSLTTEQANWTRNVRDRCANDVCLAKVLVERATALRTLKAARLAETARTAGYVGHAIYSDLLAWPNDRSRSIAVFASQNAAQKSGASEAEPNHEFLLDIYIVETKSGKVLEHISDKLPSAEMTVLDIRTDPKDYGAVLQRPSFGIVVEYSKVGEGSQYYGTSSRIYSVISQVTQPVIENLVTESRQQMAHANCSGEESYRSLRSDADTKGPFPDLTVIEDTEIESTSGKQEECISKGSQKKYSLHFDGKRYSMPKHLKH